MRKMNTYINRILSFLLVATMVLQLQPQYIYANEPETGNTIVDEVVTPADADNTDKPEEPSPDIEEEQNPNTEEPSPNPNEEQNVEETPIVQKQPEPSEEQVPPVETEEQVSTASDGTLAGQPIRFVNLYWETNDLGELEVVFDGGSQEQKVLPLIKQDRGVYEGSIPTGDYSTVAFRQKGSTEILEDTRYNIYGNQEALIAEGQEKTSVVSYTNLIKDTFYYDMGKNPSYWASDPEYDNSSVMTLANDSSVIEGNPSPGEMVFAVDLNQRENYLSGKEYSTYRIHIGFLKRNHNQGINGLQGVTPDDGEIYTMYEREPGLYTAPFPENVEQYSEIGFAATNKEGQLTPPSQNARHFNFRGEKPTEAEGHNKFGYFKYLNGYLDTYYMNVNQDDSYWGAHPSTADQSLDTQQMYVDVEDYTNNGIIANIDNLWISWNGMPTQEGSDSFDPTKGYKVVNEIAGNNQRIRYFQIPKNSNATENTIFTIRFQVINKNTGDFTEQYGEQEFTYKFTLIPRSNKNRLKLDNIWEFNGEMWDHFQPGENLQTRTIFLASIRNNYQKVWMRVKSDSGYLTEEDYKKWDIDGLSDKLDDIDGTTWIQMDKVENTSIYNKEKDKLFNITIPGAYKEVQFRTQLDKKFYYSNITTVTEEAAYPCFFVFQVGKELDKVPEEEQKEPGIVGYWSSVYSTNTAGDQSIDIPEGDMQWEENAYYVDTDMYDYYSDFETTGRKITDWDVSGWGKEQILQHYKRQAKVLNNALDFHYQEYAKNTDAGIENSQLEAMYATGFGGRAGEGGNKYYEHYNEFTEKDYFRSGHQRENDDYPGFTGPNGANRWTGSGKGPRQGIVANTLTKNGDMVLMDGDKPSELVVPFFDEAFLRGDNMMDSALGNVYKNVKFPIKMEMDEKSADRGYWVYDSARDEDAFRLSYDVDDGYFMKRTNDGIKFRGRNAFYPFNDDQDFGDNHNIDENEHNRPYDPLMAKANVMFGSKMTFNFKTTKDGTVVDLDGNKKPITFTFQGDDDTWIFIDGVLALDLGGIHDAVRGTINFQDKTYEIKRNLGTNFAGKGDLFASGELPKELIESLKDPTKTHTLTMFYMERGLYESNLKLTFNFPRENRFIVEKEVDVDSTRTEGEDIFANLLENVGSFNFNIKNLVTNGEEVKVEDSAGYKQPGENTPVYNGLSEPKVEALFQFQNDAGTITGDNIKTIVQNSNIKEDVPPIDSLLSISRIGNQVIDVTKRNYLRLSMTNLGETDRTASNLYIGLLDSNGKRVGGYASNLEYEGQSNTFLTNEESIIRIDYTKMSGDKDFDWTKVNRLLIGIRSRNENTKKQYSITYASFFSRAEEVPHVGFYVDDTQISDYGSFNSGKLSPVDGAWYIKQNKNGVDANGNNTYDIGTSWNAEAGTFNLGDDQRVIFTDKFRTGSYINLEENRDEKVFDTQWTIREGGNEIPAKYLLTTRNDITTIKNPLDVIEEEYPLSNKSGDIPGDNRQEIVDKNWNQGKFKQPDTSQTILYRSYQDPDSSANIGTDLQVKVKNLLKRGTLTITKKLDDSMKDTNGKYKPATFKFNIYYTDVAGRALEKQLNAVDENERYLLQTVTVTTDESGQGSVVVPNIPAGTKYWIEEVPSNGTNLTKIELGELAKNNPHEDVEIKGIIDENNYSQAYVVGTAYASNQEVIFTNKLSPFYMNVEKIWKDNLTDAEREQQLSINEVHIQLQRRYRDDENSEWQVVTNDYFDNPVGAENEHYIVLNKDNNWKTTSKTALPVKEEDSGRYYEYRIFEMDHQNIFNYYEVTYDFRREKDFEDDQGQSYMNVTYQAINTPAQLKLQKLWSNEQQGNLIDMVRVKLVVSTDSNAEEWMCYKRLTNSMHSCDNNCYIELNRRSDWTYSMQNLPEKDDNGLLYYYKLADEQIFLNGGWKDVSALNGTCKVTYGDPVTLQKVESPDKNAMPTVTITNEMNQGNIKIVKEDKATQAKLPNAEFKLELLKHSGELPEEVKPEEFDKLKVNPNFKPVKKKTDNNGEITFEKLPYGIYKITEVAPPSGYIALKKPVYVIISDKAFEDQANENKGDTSVDTNTKTITVTIKNEKGLTIPETGGRGILMFTIIGTLLISIAVILTIRKKYNLQ